MGSARLSASVEAAGLIRRVQAAGDFATVLRKGDPDRGSLLLAIRSRDRHVAVLERMFDINHGGYRWIELLAPDQERTDENLAEFLAKRLRFDEDLWLIELDVAQPERFIAETTLTG